MRFIRTLIYMNNNIKTALFLAVDLFLFISISTYIVYTFIDTPKNFNELTQKDTFYMTSSKEMPEADIWSGSEVVAKLYRIADDNVPIRVDNRLYNTEADVKAHQSKVPLAANYIFSLNYNDEGSISEIVFKKTS